MPRAGSASPDQDVTPPLSAAAHSGLITVAASENSSQTAGPTEENATDPNISVCRDRRRGSRLQPQSLQSDPGEPISVSTSYSAQSPDGCFTPTCCCRTSSSAMSCTTLDCQAATASARPPTVSLPAFLRTPRASDSRTSLDASKAAVSAPPRHSLDGGPRASGDCRALATLQDVENRVDHGVKQRLTLFGDWHCQSGSDSDSGSKIVAKVPPERSNFARGRATLLDLIRTWIRAAASAVPVPSEREVQNRDATSWAGSVSPTPCNPLSVRGSGGAVAVAGRNGAAYEEAADSSRWSSFSAPSAATQTPRVVLPGPKIIDGTGLLPLTTSFPFPYSLESSAADSTGEGGSYIQPDTELGSESMNPSRSNNSIPRESVCARLSPKIDLSGRRICRLLNPRSQRHSSHAASAGSSMSVLMIIVVAFSAVTGFLMGYDLCIVAVILKPIKDDFNLCAPESPTAVIATPTTASVQASNAGIGLLRRLAFLSGSSPCRATESQRHRKLRVDATGTPPETLLVGSGDLSGPGSRYWSSLATSRLPEGEELLNLYRSLTPTRHMQAEPVEDGVVTPPPNRDFGAAQQLAFDGVPGQRAALQPPKNDGYSSCLAKELFVAMVSPGAALGSLGAGFIADAFGRITALALADVLVMAGSLCMGFGTRFAFLLAGRFILGLGIGTGFVVFSTYVAEISPDNRRGQLVSCQEVAQCAGCLAAYGFAVLGASTRWRLLLIGAGIVAFTQALGVILLLPESPRWYVRVGQHEKAEIALRRLAGLPKRRTIHISGESNHHSTRRADDCTNIYQGSYFDTCSREDAVPAGPSSSSSSSSRGRNRLAKPLGCGSSDVAPQFCPARRTVQASGAGAMASQSGPDTEDAHDSGEARETAESFNVGSTRRVAAAAPSSISSQGGSGFAPAHRLLVKEIRISKTMRNMLSEAEQDRQCKRSRRRASKTSTSAERHDAEPCSPRSASSVRRAGLMPRSVEEEDSRISPLLSSRESEPPPSACSSCEGLRLSFGPYRHQTLVALGCAVAQNFTASTAMLYYSTDLFLLAGVKNPFIPGFGIGAAKLVGIILVIMYVEKVGRRRFLISGSIGTFLCHVCFIIIFAVPEVIPSALPIWTMIAYMLFQNLSWSGLMFVVASEVLPSSVRAIGMGFTITTFWLLAFVNQSTLETLIELITAPGTFALFAITNALSILFAYCCIPELDDHSLEGINKAMARRREKRKSLAIEPFSNEETPQTPTSEGVIFAGERKHSEQEG